MTSKEALEDIKDWIEYFTRLDYVEPIVRGEVQDKFKKAYWGTLPHLELIEKDLDVLEAIKNSLTVERIPPKPFDPNEEFNFDSYIQYIIKYNTYIFDKKLRDKLTQWIIDNIDKETVRKWLKNGSD